MLKKSLLSAILALFIGANINSQTWKVAGNQSFASTLMYGFARIGIAPNGTLWALINNKSTNGVLEVYKLPKDSSTWTKVGRGVFYDNAYFGSITADNTNNPWLTCKSGLYYLQGKKWTPTYAGTYWTDGPKLYAKQYELGNNSSIAADSKGKIYVANDYYAGVYIKDEKLAASSWDEKVYDASRMVSFFPIGNDKSENGIGYRATPNNAANPVIKVVNDVLYLAYDEYRGMSHWGFHVSKWNGKGWTDLGDFGSNADATGGFSEGAADDLDVAISKTGKVFIAYREGSGAKADVQWKASAMMYNGNDDWTVMGKKGFSAGTTEAFPFSAAFDSKETPYVCYADEENGTINVMKFTGGQWVKLGGDVASGAAPSMIIGPDNTMYVIYREKGKELITVKKFKL
jgi:hypothetical protein